MEFNGTFLATIITFIVFVFIMNKILYAPILGIMEERQNLINKNYKDAKENDAKSEQITEEHNSKLSDAKSEARSKYTEKINEYKNERTEELKSAQDKAKEDLENSKRDLDGISDRVKDSLKGSITELAGDIAEKILGYRSEIETFDDNVVNTVLWGDK